MASEEFAEELALGPVDEEQDAESDQQGPSGQEEVERQLGASDEDDLWDTPICQPSSKSKQAPGLSLGFALGGLRQQQEATPARTSVPRVGVPVSTPDLQAEPLPSSRRQSPPRSIRRADDEQRDPPMTQRGSAAVPRLPIGARTSAPQGIDQPLPSHRAPRENPPAAQPQPAQPQPASHRATNRPAPPPATDQVPRPPGRFVQVSLMSSAFTLDDLPVSQGVIPYQLQQSIRQQFSSRLGVPTEVVRLYKMEEFSRTSGSGQGSGAEPPHLHVAAYIDANTFSLQGINDTLKELQKLKDTVEKKEQIILSQSQRLAVLEQNNPELQRAKEALTKQLHETQMEKTTMAANHKVDKDNLYRRVMDLERENAELKSKEAQNTHLKETLKELRHQFGQLTARIPTATPRPGAVPPHT